jgi:ankyrin repeat protein
MIMDIKTHIGVELLSAFDAGDLVQVDRLFFDNNRNVLEVSQTENWNWLHKNLLGFDSNIPPKKSIEYLIKKGVPINAQDCYGMTPLHYAMRSKNAEAALVLLQAGANPNIPNQDGVIPLIHARKSSLFRTEAKTEVAGLKNRE